MSNVKEYISNITIPDGTTKYVKDADLTNNVNELTTKVSANSTQIKTNEENILTNTTKIGENTSVITDLKSKVDDMINKIYPVGSIYLSMNTTNPSILFGGNWERIKDRFLLGCGDSYTSIGTYGGEEKHTLTIDEMPSHSHTVTLKWTEPGGASVTSEYSESADLRIGDYQTETNGGGQPHNNMPPYVTCYMWQRTA